MYLGLLIYLLDVHIILIIQFNLIEMNVVVFENNHIA